MSTLSRSRITRKLIVLVVPVALVLMALGGPSASAAVRKALINAASVTGSPSQEEQIATAAGFTVTVVSDATWAGMTAAQFGEYELLISGDPTCGDIPAGVISSAGVYGPVVMGHAGGRTAPGNRIVVGTDPVYHDGGDFTSPNARGTIIREGINFAGALVGRTGMYFDPTCGGENEAGTLAVINAISAGTGTWTIDSVPPCGGSVSLIAAHPAFTDLSTVSLQGWSCSVHESFPTFKSDWSALAVATDTASHPTCGVDPDTKLGACGEAYILISGTAIVVNSLVISISPLDATNPVGTDHTVTANVHTPPADAATNSPVAGQKVDFSVTGQNAGATGTCVPADCKSDASGNVTFTYHDGAGAGDDTIKASFTDVAGSLQAATAQKHWGGEGPPPTPTPTPTPTPPTCEQSGQPCTHASPTPAASPTPTPAASPTPQPTPQPTPTPEPTPEQPTGGVLPATDTPPSGPSAPSDDSALLVVLGLTGLLATILLLTPARSVASRRNR